MVTGVTGSGPTTAVAYRIGCATSACDAASCWATGTSKIDVATNLPMCIVTSKTKSTGSSAVQFIRITTALTFTGSAYLTSQCMTATVNGIYQTICDSDGVLTSFQTLQSGMHTRANSDDC